MVSGWQRKKSRFPAQTITDADYTDDIALLTNTPAQAQTLLQSVGIGLDINTDKIEYICFDQRGDISTLKCGSLKLVNKFTHLSSRVSLTETDINPGLAKARIANDRLSVIWKSDLTDKIKRSFFQVGVVSILLYGCTTWMLTKRVEEKLTPITQECCKPYWTSPEGNTPLNSRCTATYYQSRKLLKLDEPDLRDTAGEVRTN